MDYLQYTKDDGSVEKKNIFSFKPYYKWITFNTMTCMVPTLPERVLNLIINGLPSIRRYI